MPERLRGNDFAASCGFSTCLGTVFGRDLGGGLTQLINRALIKERLAMIACSISRLEDLASESRDDFLAPGSDLPAVAESHLRRSLEAIFDIGRHVLAKTRH